MANIASKIKMDEFVAKAIPDPKQHEPLKVISGFIGASSQDGHVRVYGDESLNHFVDVAEDSIVHSEERPKGSFPLGGSFLWVKAGAEYVYGNPADANRPRAKFLEGDLFTQYRHVHPEARAQTPAPREQEGPGPQSFPCHTTDPSYQQGCRTNPCASEYACFTKAECPTKGGCPTVGGGCTESCPTFNGCPSDQCYSWDCPGPSDNCPQPQEGMRRGFGYAPHGQFNPYYFGNRNWR